MNQINGTYVARDDRMAVYLAKAQEQIAAFSHFTIGPINREQNQHTDALASLASAVSPERRRTITVEHLDRPST